MPSTYLTNGFTATVLETREIVHCPDPFDIRFRYEVQLSGGNDSEKAAAPVNSGSLAELSQLPTFFGFFVLIFIVKPRVFIVAF